MCTCELNIAIASAFSLLLCCAIASSFVANSFLRRCKKCLADFDFAKHKSPSKVENMYNNFCMQSDDPLLTLSGECAAAHQMSLGCV